jgi:hypothetical protein
MSQLLYFQGKSPWYPLERRLIGPRGGLDAVENRTKLGRQEAEVIQNHEN